MKILKGPEKLRRRSKDLKRVEITVSDSNLLEKYVRKFEIGVGVKNLPLDYFKKNHCVVFLDKNNNVFAGYCVATKNLRGFNVKNIDSNLNNNNLKKNNFFEINGVFISRKVSGKIFRFRFWSHLLKDISFLCRNKYLLLWFNRDIPYLKKLYSCIRANKIYEGKVTKGDNKTHSNIFIGYQSIPNLFVSLFRGYFFYLRSA